ncbi:Transcription initiation factor TFIID subunit 2 [Rhizoctonia solani]|uniref:Transcription initiation factor TFIID subunit 2 n=1 Tax=Rhizoctonia solani TaxID=456999 RepID=A0A0K6GFP0_9AGAM|nr:Transcription initiation factor TFIID subunit 2 [Rhizoctonia solani]
MVVTPSNALRPRWGHPISVYPAFYTNEALADRLKAPVKAKERAASRTIALSTIKEICTLGDSTIKPSQYGSVFDKITLSKLESILDLTRFPDEYENLALPKLVAGCIELLSCITPSPFAYEYGYLCFRTLVFALNTCLLKYGGVWDEVIGLMKDKPLSERISCFWDRSAKLAADEAFYFLAQNNMHEDFDDIRLRRWSVPYFDQKKLEKLQTVLHSDRKHLLIALRDTRSLGLSTLFLVLKRHMESKRHTSAPRDHRFTGTSCYFPELKDLIPDLFEAAIQALWNPLPDSIEVRGLDLYVLRTMHAFCILLNRLETEVTRSRRVENSWIYKLGDKIIESDVVGLIVCSASLKLAPEPDDLEYTSTKRDQWTSTQQFLNLATFVPPHYLRRQINNSGCLHDWWKYFTHLGALAPGGLELVPTDPRFSMQGFAAQLIHRICLELLGARLEDSVSTFEERGEMCKNPRCPAPFGTGLTTTIRTNKHVWTDDPYCDSRCLKMHQKVFV